MEAIEAVTIVIAETTEAVEEDIITIEEEVVWTICIVNITTSVDLQKIKEEAKI
tara:strand:+ start:78 stop:239 length:162 start_codon:yes stop_codon:yes gene_type:complete